MKFLKILIIVLVISALFLLFYIRTKRRALLDTNTDYGVVELHGKISKSLEGETILIYNYNRLSEINKKKYILETIKQGSEIEDENGFKYIVSELLSESGNSDNKDFKRINDSIIYKVISKSEKIVNKYYNNIHQDIHQENTSGENNLYINWGSDKANQTINKDTFSNLICQYKTKLLEKGISQEDINNVINNLDKNTRKSFLSKYKIELVNIIIKMIDSSISLYDVLTSHL